MSKKIYVSTYGQKYRESSLVYSEEIYSLRVLIKFLVKKNAALNTDSAYLLIKNSFSSINSYKIITD